MKKYLCLLLLLVGACARDQITMLDKEYPEVSPKNVKVYMNDPVPCKYKEIAYIGTEYEDDMPEAVASAREKAAEIGADGIIILNHKTNDDGEVTVGVSAYKCTE